MSGKVFSTSDSLRDEILRKAIHIGAGIAISVLYSMYQRNLLIALLLLSLFFVFSLEALRLKGILTVPLLRDMEKKKIGAYAFFMMGAFMSILLFERQIAIASIVMLAIGDAASGIAQSIKRGTLNLSCGLCYCRFDNNSNLWCNWRCHSRWGHSRDLWLYRR